MIFKAIISVFLGIGLAASVGFRVFVPLFVLSLVYYFDVWQLNESWQWIGITITLGIATLVEVFAYYIPYIDNLLDTISVPLASLAGTTVMLSTVSDLSSVITWTSSIIAGSGKAAAISGTSSTTRLASMATTDGLANPLVTTIETVIPVIMSTIFIFTPVIAIIFVIIILFLIFKLYRKFKPNKS